MKTSARVRQAADELKSAVRREELLQEDADWLEARLDRYTLKGKSGSGSEGERMQYLQERYYDGGPIDYSAPRGGW